MKEIQMKGFLELDQLNKFVESTPDIIVISIETVDNGFYRLWYTI